MKPKPVLMLVAVTILLATLSCTRRMAPFSPRINPTEAHKQATTPQQCRECHRIAELPQHKASDDCLRCHHILPGG